MLTIDREPRVTAGATWVDENTGEDATGHADPRTTRRYDRGRHSLDRHASYALTSWLDGSGPDDHEPEHTRL